MASSRNSEDYVVRFSTWARFQHAAVIVLFFLLVAKGLTQKWPQAELSQWTVDLFGGIFVTRWLHRVSGVVFTLLTVAHLSVVVGQLWLGRAKPTMLLSRRDFQDVIQTLRYYRGKTEEPAKFGRYDYGQKFEYWGLIFGSAIMILTGFILIFPVWISRILPAELIPAAKEAHTNEAMMALAIILVWHLYGAHFKPEVFPADGSIFSGRISRERLAEEHPREYEELFPQESVAPS
jgi:formate dehydrogenase gamma subunit